MKKTNPQRRHVAKLKRLAIQAVGLTYCRDCGATTGLEFAHVKDTGLEGRSRGSKERYRDVIAHPACYTRLCVDCHVMADRGRDGNGEAI